MRRSWPTSTTRSTLNPRWPGLSRSADEPIERIGHHDQAAADFDHAVELDPVDDVYLMERALTRGIDHIGTDHFQLIADVEATLETAAPLGRMITDWLISAGIMESERTASVPGSRGGHAPGQSRGAAVAEPFPGDDPPDRLYGILVLVGRQFCHQLTMDTATCPSCSRRIKLHQNGQLTPVWERVIDAITSFGRKVATESCTAPHARTVLISVTGSSTRLVRLRTWP